MQDSDGKSMNDVLASIRKIVRTEKEGEVASTSGDAPDEADRSGPADEQPLVLTPEMRTDAAAEENGAAAPGEREARAEPGIAAADADALRGALRELLREELSGGAAEEAVRGIIRDELTGGQIGSNITQNVVRLIRAEVAKAMQAPR